MPRSRQEQAIGTQGQSLLLDYYLIPEIEKGCPRGYPGRVRSSLAQYKVFISTKAIYGRAQKIISGRSILRPSADVNGTPTARDGKDNSYAGFWTMVDVSIPYPGDRRYVGLAANQLDVIRSHIGYPVLVVCEKVPERAEEYERLASMLERFRPGPKIEVKKIDIFKHLRQNPEKYNIFDLDLMCQLPDTKKIDRWCRTIYKAAYPGKVVIGITTGIGRRGNTNERYNQRAEYLRRALASSGFEENGYSRFAYKDRIIPMRSERFILTKK